MGPVPQSSPAQHYGSPRACAKTLKACTVGSTCYAPLPCEMGSNVFQPKGAWICTYDLTCAVNETCYTSSRVVQVIHEVSNAMSTTANSTHILKIAELQALSRGEPAKARDPCCYSIRSLGSNIPWFRKQKMLRMMRHAHNATMIHGHRWTLRLPSVDIPKLNRLK